MTMADPDQLSTGKTIYEARPGEIFWRNFLAGFARGLGNFIFTVIIFLFLTFLTAQFLMPVLEPLLGSMTRVNGLFETLSPTNQSTPQDGRF